MKTEAKKIFEAYPKATELYMDTNGVIWTEKQTAINQSKGAEITVIKKEIQTKKTNKK